MRTLTLYTLLLFTFGVHSQDYVQAELDPNKLFGLIDNPRTATDHRGLDFDIEAGSIYNNFSMYVFYGYFHNAEYHNYGAGGDYYLINNKQFSLAAGPAVSVVLRKNPETESYGAFVGYHLRTTGILWFTDRFGATGTLQWQNRGDLKVSGIIEGRIGLRYNLKL